MALKLINTENLDTLADKMKARTGTEGKLVFPEGFNNEVDNNLISRKRWIQLLGGNNTQGELEELTADDTRGVTIIRENAFNALNSLKKATIHSDVKTIYWAAFRACNNLKEVIIADGGLTLIYSNAFAYSALLERLDLTSYGTDKSFPRLNNVNALSGTSSALKIVVPYGRREELISMTNWSTFADRIYSQAVDFLLGTWSFENCPSAPQPSLYTYNIEFIVRPSEGIPLEFTQLGLEIADTEDGTNYYMYFYYEDGSRIVAYDDSQGGWLKDEYKNISIVSVNDTPEKVDELYNIFDNSGASKIGNIETWEFKEDTLSNFEGDYYIIFKTDGMYHNKISFEISSGAMSIYYKDYFAEGMEDRIYAYEAPFWTKSNYRTITIVSTEGETEERLQAFYTWLKANAKKL